MMYTTLVGSSSKSLMVSRIRCGLVTTLLADEPHETSVPSYCRKKTRFRACWYCSASTLAESRGMCVLPQRCCSSHAASSLLRNSENQCEAVLAITAACSFSHRRFFSASGMASARESATAHMLWSHGLTGISAPPKMDALPVNSLRISGAWFLSWR